MKLSVPRLLIRAAIIVVAVIVWFWVASWLIRFGKTMDYGALAAAGQQTIDLLNRINPYLWYAAVVIWTLIVYFIVRAMIDNSIQAGRATPVPTAALADLTANLSDETLDVMLWCWGSREEPFTQGDLRRSRTEIRHGRIEKIAMVREQEALLRGDRPAAGSLPPGSPPPARPRPNLDPAASRIVQGTPGRLDKEPTIVVPPPVERG